MSNKIKLDPMREYLKKYHPDQVPPPKKRAPRDPNKINFKPKDYIANVDFELLNVSFPVIVGPPKNKSHFRISSDLSELIYKTWRPSTKDFTVKTMISNKQKTSAFTPAKIEAAKKGIYIRIDELSREMQEAYFKQQENS
jgi:hypothetical protein